MTDTLRGSAASAAGGPQALQLEFLRFKRTLHLIRTSTDLHHAASATGVPILGLLHRQGPARTTAIAADMCLDPSTVSRQVDAVVRAGLAEKVPDPADRRATLVRLTDHGRDELQRHVDILSDVLSGLLDDWSPQDIDTLTTLLGRLNDDVTARLTTTSHEETP